jgi:enoyl-CoA hydratase/carnithine racemase
MRAERVRIERDGGVATVVLARPERHNGMDFGMLDAVRRAARELKRDKTLRAVILRGDGPSFCSGLDFQSLAANPIGTAAAALALLAPVRNRFQEWSLLWREVPAPVIAAVHGNCLGAGLQLALGADLRITTPDARWSIMEAKWGLIPDMGGTVLLRELVGIDVAKELTMTARVISGEAAQAIGLATHVDADPLARAQTLCAEILTRSSEAVAAAKFVLQEAWTASEDVALAAERQWQRRIIGRRAQRDAVRRNLKGGA